MKIVVTGGDGFIGSHLVDALITIGKVPVYFRSGERYSRRGFERASKVFRNTAGNLKEIGKDHVL